MRLSSLTLLLLAAPIVGTALFAITVAAGEQRGSNPFSAPPYRNSAEAAAAGDPATMLRFVRMGDDPTRIKVVGPEAISSQVLRVTTLEAAMWSRSIEMIHVLDREGAIIDDAQRKDLACLAVDLDMPDAKAYLAPDAECVRGVAVERIIARSKPEAASRHE